MNLKLKAHSEILLKKDFDLYLNDLSEITFTRYGKGKAYDFEGHVDFDNKKFEIAQLFDYGNGNMVRPIISGKLIENGNEPKLNLDFRAEGFIKTFLFFGVFLSIAVPPLAYFFIEKEQVKWFLVLGSPIGSFIFYLQCLAMFHNKVYDCLLKLEWLNR